MIDFFLLTHVCFFGGWPQTYAYMNNEVNLMAITNSTKKKDLNVLDYHRGGCSWVLVICEPKLI